VDVPRPGTGHRGTRTRPDGPVIRTPDRTSAAWPARSADLAGRTATTGLPDDLSGGTFNADQTPVARRDVFDTRIINQAAGRHLGTGVVVKRTAVVNRPGARRGNSGRSIVYLALSYANAWWTAPTPPAADRDQARRKEGRSSPRSACRRARPGRRHTAPRHGAPF